MKLKFQRSKDECCLLCNWVALADLETEAVRVDLDALHPRKHGRAICFPCIDALSRARKGRRDRAVSVELDPELVTFLRDRGA